MVWKIIPVESTGNNLTYGGDDTKKIHKLFAGYDLTLENVSDKVEINTPTTFSSEKFNIKSPTTGYKYIFKTSDIEADRTIILPLMTDNAELSLAATTSVNDWGNNMQTFRHQYIKIMNPANTFGYIFNTSAIATNINLTLPVLSADDTFVFTNASQVLYNKTLNSPTISAMTINTDSNTIKHSTTNQAGDLLVNTGSKFDRFARGGANQVPIMNPTGTGWTWIDKTALQGEPGAPGEPGTGDYQFPIVQNVISGAWFGTTAAGGSGCWSGFLTDTSNVTPTNISDSTGRIGIRYSFNSDEDRGGFVTNSQYFTIDNNPELWVRYACVSGVDDYEYRITIGFVDDTSADYGTGDDTLAGRKCFTWYKEIQDTTNINIGHNDGDATGNKTSTVTLSSADTSIHTIRLVGESANNRFGISLDGANAQYVTTEIPVSGERLGCIVQFENEDSNSRVFEVYGAYFKCTVV